MGLAEDLKALQELREKGELSEADYAATRDAALGKHAPVTKTAPPISKSAKTFLAFIIMLVVLGVIVRIYTANNSIQNATPSHIPITITDEVQNVPANSWKALNYICPMGGKLDITVNVVNGNPIDLFLTTADQLDAMNKGEWQNIKVFSDFNATKTRTYHRTQSVGPGNYYFVLRDTSLGVLSAHASDVSVKTILTP
jgi:hypothetical protein